MTTLRGARAWVFGDSVSIEAISPLRYMLSPEGRGRHCLEILDAEFAAADKQNDVIIAGSLFGRGPGHDHAVLAIKESGIAGVVATSFAPQFFRHAVGHGLRVATAPAVDRMVSRGDRLDVDFEAGRLCIARSDSLVELVIPAGPAAEILDAGGLLPFIRARLRDDDPSGI